MTAKNVITNCTKFNQCYFVKAIVKLKREYDEAYSNMIRLDVRRWSDYHRGSHQARIAACHNTGCDLEDLVSTVDPSLLNMAIGEGEI